MSMLVLSYSCEEFSHWLQHWRTGGVCPHSAWSFLVVVCCFKAIFCKSGSAYVGPVVGVTNFLIGLSVAERVGLKLIIGRPSSNKSADWSVNSCTRILSFFGRPSVPDLLSRLKPKSYGSEQIRIWNTGKYIDTLTK